MRSRVTTIATIVAAAILAAASTAATSNRAFADDNNGLIVPMYGWDAGWSEVIHAKKENPGTRIIVVINPDGGPGSGKSSHWANIVNDLQDSHIRVVGYVSTSYASRSISSVKDEISHYYHWYGVNGIFLDEVSTDSAKYYKSIHRYAEKPSGSQDVILNPGAPVPSSYKSAGDIIIVYENSGMPSINSHGIKESKLGALPYGFTPSKSDFDSASDKVKYLYMAPGWMHVASNIEEQADWAN